MINSKVESKVEGPSEFYVKDFGSTKKFGNNVLDGNLKMF